MADEQRCKAERDSSISKSESDDSSTESSESCSSDNTSSSSSQADCLKDHRHRENSSVDDINRHDLKSYKRPGYTKRKTEGADDDIPDRRKRGKYSDKEKHDGRNFGKNTGHGGNSDKIFTKHASRKENFVKDESQRELPRDRSVRHKEKQSCEQDYGNKHNSYKSYDRKRSSEHAVRGSASKHDYAKGDMKASKLRHHQDDSEYFDRKNTEEEYESRRRGHQRATSRGSNRRESDKKHHRDDSQYYERKSIKEEYEGRRGRNHQRSSHRKKRRSESEDRRARHVREWDIGKSSSGNEQIEREHAETGNTGEGVKSKQKKDEPNYELSGKLTEFTNTYKGVVIKYNEPPEARKPKTKWRIYPFKGDESLPVLYIHRQSAFLLGRNRLIADIPIDHPSCSSQHAVIQFRFVDYEKPDGMMGKRVRPYVIDLESSNGTFVNNNKIEPRRYVELKEKDVLKFGFSSREYVVLHDQSQVALPEDAEKD